MPTASRHPDTALAVFLAFLKLGCSAFGGPIAHLGYFRDEFVRRRGWLSESSYASQLVQTWDAARRDLPLPD
ncbi:chromate transporter, partial [Pseudomonas aeruginosa]|nr:chromate transporter [Pseudomonas aeruginosa]